MLKIILFLLLFSNFVIIETSRVPKLSDHYSIEGIISLPLAEIKEPFVGYFDGTNNRSRVDYYGDLVQTIQRPDLNQTNGGIIYKLVFKVDAKGDPQKVCFTKSGTNEKSVISQSVLPDLSSFNKTGSEVCPNYFGNLNEKTICERFKSIVEFGDKTNEYIFWLMRDNESNPIPVQLLMKGYDFLLGSHYDRFVIYYKNYKPVPVEPQVFEVQQNYSCEPFPDNRDLHIGDHNPIREYINGVDTHVDMEFNKFMDRHHKNYVNETHERQRKNIFRQNLRFIYSKNRQNIDFTLGVNHLTDLTDDEFRGMTGGLYSSEDIHHRGGQVFNKTKYNLKDIPLEWDWRLKGAVTPIKDQEVCGSCWAFATTGAIEGAYFLKTGHLVRLSEQQLVDCSWNEGNNGCEGGYDYRSYKYIMKTKGISTEEDYGNYLAADGKCHDKSVNKTVLLDGFLNIPMGDTQALEAAIFFKGPISVGFDAHPKSFRFYASGVYYEPECKTQTKDINHVVLAIGFGTLHNQRYWLIKNQWTTHWGNHGYLLISQKNNSCGVTTISTVPIIADY